MSITNAIRGVISIKHFRPIALAIALLVGVAIPVVAVPSASAVGGCPANYVCLYDHKSYGGSQIWIAAQPNICYTVGVVDNKVSSVVNATSRQVKYYDGYCHGCRLDDGPGDYRENLTNDFWSSCWPGIANDKITTFMVF